MRPPHGTPWWAAAVVLAVLGAICVVLGSGRPGSEGDDESPPDGPPVAHSETQVREHPQQAAVVRTGRGRPVELQIPAIDVTTSLTGLGLNPDGTVEVPADPDEAGWYHLGTRPGARGSAVILGHVDSTEGPGVFYRLSSLEAGDDVEVEMSKGAVLTFRVRSVSVYPNDEFPARKVYAARRGRILNLVTCGGDYDAALGGYQANVVVRATLVA